MPLKPDQPFPKKQGDNIRSKDWNDAVNEIIRLDSAKLNLGGGNLTGPLNVSGNLGVGTTTPGFPLTFSNAVGDKLSLWGQSGNHYGFGIQAGLLQIHTDGAGSDIAFGFGTSSVFSETMRIKGNGNVGIGTDAPNRTLTILGVAPSFGLKTHTGTELLFAVNPIGGVGMISAPQELQFRAGGGGAEMTIKASGNIGVGVADPGTTRFLVANVPSWDQGLGVSGDTDAGVGLYIDNKRGRRWHLISSGKGNTNGLGSFGIWDDKTNAFRLTIDTGGNVGIGVTDAKNRLHVEGATGIRQNYLYLSGAKKGSSFSYNAHRNATNNDWVFPDPSEICVTVEMDSERNGRFEIYSTAPGAKTSWDRKLWLDCPTGRLLIKSTFHAGGADLAENYPSKSNLEPGDVVCLSPHENVIVRSERSNDGTVVGVISTNPGCLLNSPIDQEEEDSGGLKKYPVALCGRIPCKVTDENGPIKRGDFLTPSSTPGHAMRAEPLEINGQRFFSPGTIIGKALGSLDEPNGVIEIFISLR